MTLTVAARQQMADLEARRSNAQRADLEAATADALDRLRPFDHCFTTWKKAGQSVGRNGLVIGFDEEARTLKLLEITPETDSEPCVACGRVPHPQRSETRIFTLDYANVTEVHRPDWAARTGWGLRLLGAVLDGRNVSDPRARQLLAWAGQLGVTP